jgi:hypothetical protein
VVYENGKIAPQIQVQEKEGKLAIITLFLFNYIPNFFSGIFMNSLSKVNINGILNSLLASNFPFLS